MTWTDQTAPSLDDFARLARQSFAALPEPFRSLAGERGDVGLSEIIAHVLIHEIGHHFGLDDDRIDVIEEETDE